MAAPSPPASSNDLSYFSSIVNTVKMVGAQVMFASPSADLFAFPPDRDPLTLPPPPPHSAIAPPFHVSDEWYGRVLQVHWPITIALVYATTVTILNQVNKRRGYKPYGFSKTAAFYWFVVAHNVFLAVYSFWTFVGITKALHRSFPSFNGPDGVTGVVDALCKINGPGGLGNAFTYSHSAESWVSTSPKSLVGLGGVPQSSDEGRLWNEGLAFYGWWFYLSKFYEVVDTAIILAKGKKSSTLQTYHHAGAMMCMWAGIRFMAPPIWLFVTANSLIHAMMVSPKSRFPFVYE
jgi:GNS1/SUR4 family